MRKKEATIVEMIQFYKIIQDALQSGFNQVYVYLDDSSQIVVDTEPKPVQKCLDDK